MRRLALAKTLKVVAGKGGLEMFYKGWIAESLARAAREAGGVVTKEDFGEFFTVVEEAVGARALGREFLTCGTPCRWVARVVRFKLGSSVLTGYAVGQCWSRH